MKSIQHRVLLALMLCLAPFAFAHEGVHLVGQVHAAGHHMGLFEVALGVLGAGVLYLLYAIYDSSNRRK